MQIEPTSEIKAAIDSLILANKTDTCIYELFINQYDEDKCNMVLNIDKTSYAMNSNPTLAYMMSNNIKIDVYSGTELYFHNFNIKEEQSKKTKGISKDRK